MKRLIVRSIQTLSTIVIVLMLVFGLVAGAVVGNEYGAPGIVLGAVVGLVSAFVSACLVFGALYILIDMDDSLRAIRALLERQAATKA